MGFSHCEMRFMENRMIPLKENLNSLLSSAANTGDVSSVGLIIILCACAATSTADGAR